MICARCSEFGDLLAVEEYIIRSAPEKGIILEEFFDSIACGANIGIVCQGCGNHISKTESYFDDENEYKEPLYHFIAEEVTSKIVACSSCSYPDQIFISMRHGGYFDEDDDIDGMINELDTSEELGEFIYDQFGIDAVDEIFQSVYCPKCGKGTGEDYDAKTDYGIFDEFTTIYTQEDLDEFDQRFYGDIANVGNEVNLLADQLTMEELVNLKNDYIQNRIYASRSRAFGKLEDAIKSLYMRDFYYTLCKGRTIYRTRAMDSNYQISQSPSDDNLWEPPYGTAGHGRYNDIGASVLYCSNNLGVLRSEVKVAEGKNYVFAKFIINRSLKMFPVNYVFKRGGDNRSDFNGLISESTVSDNKAFRVEYIVSNLVAAICSRIGYNGIVYKSTKCHKSVNYAFLKFEKNRDITMVEVFKQDTDYIENE